MAFLFNGLLLIAGLVTTVVGLATLANSASNLLIVVLGVGMASIAWFRDRRRVRLRDAAVARAIADRSTALTSRPWHAHERLEISPNRLMFGARLGTTLLGGCAAYLGFRTTAIHWDLVVGGSVVLAAGALMSMTSLAGIGKAALVLDRKGLTTPLDGMVPWSAVEGIDLRVVEHRGITNYSLFFRVPAYAQVVQSIHWIQRWLALFRQGPLHRGQIAVPLRPGKERPETVEAVARHLWKSATGREYSWSPSMSNAANESFRELARLRSAIPLPEELNKAFRERPEQAIAQMEAEMARLDQVGHHLAVIDKEQGKAFRKLSWQLSLIIVFMLAALVWPWVKRSLVG